MTLLSGNLIITSDYVLYNVLGLQPCGACKYHPTPSSWMDDKLKNHRMEFLDIYLRIYEELLSFLFTFYYYLEAEMHLGHHIH